MTLPRSRKMLAWTLVGFLGFGGLSVPLPQVQLSPAQVGAALHLQVNHLQAEQPLSIGMAQAQSGGGFGGRSSGGSSSRSSGSSSSRGGGGYSGGGGYGGGPIIINNGGWGGGYYGGGLGMSLGFLPILFFGVIILVVIMGMRRSMGGGRARGVTDLGNGNTSGWGGHDGTAQAVSVQILMAQGDEVKAALQRVAQTGDPDSNEGLARMLQEAALVALRHPERWVYATVQQAQGAPGNADSQVGAWATQARAAFTEQTTSNYQNGDPRTGYSRRTDYSYNKDAGDLYLAVTIAVAAYSLGVLPSADGLTTTATVRDALGALSSVSPDDLIRGEVVWSPDTEGEFLSEDEAIQKYPRLTKL